MPKTIKPETTTLPKGFPLLTTTDGKGLWTHMVGEVKITALKIDYISDDSKFASLNAYFDPATWNRHCGLIYTDNGWATSFRKALVEQLGIPREVAESISYSEAGLQGDTYVNLDCGAAFYDFINTDGVNLLGPPPVPKLFEAPKDPILDFEAWLDERRDRNVGDVMDEIVNKVSSMLK